MYYPNYLTIYEPLLTITVLPIPSILELGGGALCSVLPTCLWLFHLGAGHPGLKIASFERMYPAHN